MALPHKDTYVDVFRAYLFAESALVASGDEPCRNCAVSVKCSRVYSDMYLFFNEFGEFLEVLHHFAALHAFVAAASEAASSLLGSFVFRICIIGRRKYRMYWSYILQIKLDLCGYVIFRVFHISGLYIALYQKRSPESLRDRLYGRDTQERTSYKNTIACSLDVIYICNIGHKTECFSV